MPRVWWEVATWGPQGALSFHGVHVVSPLAWWGRLLLPPWEAHMVTCPMFWLIWLSAEAQDSWPRTC